MWNNTVFHHLYDWCLYNQVDNASVSGIEQLERYAGCIKCTAKIICDPGDPEVGECAKRGMMQCLDAAKIGIVAHLLIKSHHQLQDTGHYMLLEQPLKI